MGIHRVVVVSLMFDHDHHTSVHVLILKKYMSTFVTVGITIQH